MIKRKRSSTTIGIYLRNLRPVYNQAINDGLISGTVKPFKNMQLGSKVKSKSVLYPAQLKQLWEYRSESLRENRAIAFFFFCYLCNGMYFKDVAYLKWKNIDGDILSFVREKTKNTKQNQSEIRVYLCDEAKKIIAIWGSKKRNYWFLKVVLFNFKCVIVFIFCPIVFNFRCNLSCELNSVSVC